MTEVKTKPLHASTMDPHEWWACSQPERPGDLDCCYDENRGACILHLHADTLIRGDWVLDDMDNEDCPPLLASQVIARFLDQP